MDKDNTISIICIDSPLSQHQHSSWGKYAIKAWEKYCDKFNLTLNVITQQYEDIHHPKFMKLFTCEINYKAPNILLVDSDTMPSPIAPNIFDEFKSGLGTTPDNSNLKWIWKSVNAYKTFFPNHPFDYCSYFNSGVMLFRREHYRFLEKCQNWYLDNLQQLRNFNCSGVGVDQTILNYLIQINDIQTVDMGYEWNSHSMNKLGLLESNFQTGDMTPYAVKYSNIVHFTGFDVARREPVMQKFYELWYE